MWIDQTTTMAFFFYFNHSSPSIAPDDISMMSEWSIFLVLCLGFLTRLPHSPPMGVVFIVDVYIFTVALWTRCLPNRRGVTDVAHNNETGVDCQCHWYRRSGLGLRSPTLFKYTHVGVIPCDAVPLPFSQPPHWHKSQTLFTPPALCNR